ncbi:hypothetical protein [Vibrio phage vB_VhaS-tm]|nr:hypothetical protein [Vibrio phage vB_VhaS-tm]
MARSVHSTNSTLNLCRYWSRLEGEKREAIRRVSVRNVNAFQALHIISKFIDRYGKEGLTLEQDNELISVEFIFDDRIIELIYDQDRSRLAIWTEWV